MREQMYTKDEINESDVLLSIDEQCVQLSSLSDSDAEKKHARTRVLEPPGRVRERERERERETETETKSVCNSAQ